MTKILVALETANASAVAELPPAAGVAVVVKAGPTRESSVVMTGRQGPAGPRGAVGPQGEPGGTTTRRIAARDMSGHRMVLPASVGSVDYASSANPHHALRVLGMTQGAAVAGDPVDIQVTDEITEPGWSWVPGPVFLGADGLLTQVQPQAPSAAFSLVVGHALSPTTIFIQLGIPISLSQE